MTYGSIDYRKIADAIDYYKNLGYQYIEVPWIVSKESIDITKPTEGKYFDTFLGHLVGSGEQSFLEIRKTLKPNTRYVCCTPCFRDEKEVNDITKNYFMKVELIHTEPPGIADLYKMMDDAIVFFRKYNRIEIWNGETLGELDLYMNGIEIGSYGIRNYDGFSWIYGTGIAEPRLSQAMKGKQC